ncbi:MAG: hypothetical protein HKN47_18625 [Pirellulaceae bacterium]|nr:hypothetical protein [Pirellulaceae bacterium]
MWKRFVDPMPILVLAGGISLGFGFFVPELFRWVSGSGSWVQTITSKRLAFWVIVATICIAALGWAWNQRRGWINVGTDSEVPPIRFGVMGLLRAMTIVALGLALTPFLSPYLTRPVACVVCWIALLSMLVWAARAHATLRKRIWLFLIVLHAPYSWLVSMSRNGAELVSAMTEFPVLPGLILAELLSPHRSDVQWITPLFTLALLAVGALVLRRGGKLSVVFLTLCALGSAGSSLMFYALCQA